MGKNIRRQRARMKRVQGMSVLLQEIGIRDAWICWLCREEVIPTDTRQDYFPTKDHLIPQSLGGPSGKWNLRIAHFGCNNGRTDSVPPPSSELLKYVDYQTHGLLRERFKRAYGYEFSAHQRREAAAATSR